MSRIIYVLAALLASLFTYANASDISYVLEGALVTPEDVIQKGKLLVDGEKIEAIGDEVATHNSTRVIQTDSIIFPGLIDLHNHLTWNVFPRWTPHRLFRDRYEWQELSDYQNKLAGPEDLLIRDHLGCDADRFAEVKALAGGATSVVGSLKASPQHPDDNSCIEGLTRNLDVYSGFYQQGVFNSEKVLYLVFPFDTDFSDLARYRAKLNEGSLKCILLHLAEGNDASARYEFRILKAQGFLREGVVIIHGTALRPPQFKAMADAGVGLVWSPRSNFELYGTTTAVSVAKEAHVAMAIAPDWSPTGSNGMLEELNYAAKWNDKEQIFSDREFFEMATSIPAKLAHLGDKIGSLSPGMYADLLLIRGDSKSPYRSLLEARPEDVRLVIVGGAPLYGDPDLMRRLLPNHTFYELTVCGRRMLLNLDRSPGDRWDEVLTRLKKNLNESDTELAPLADSTDCVR